MIVLLEAVAGWLVANVLFVAWMTWLSRRGQERRRVARGEERHGLLGRERLAESHSAGRDGQAAA
jgi:hypothetical protein